MLSSELSLYYVKLVLCYWFQTVKWYPFSLALPVARPFGFLLENLDYGLVHLTRFSIAGRHGFLDYIITIFHTSYLLQRQEGKPTVYGRRLLQILRCYG